MPIKPDTGLLGSELISRNSSSLTSSTTNSNKKKRTNKTTTTNKTKNTFTYVDRNGLLDNQDIGADSSENGDYSDAGAAAATNNNNAATNPAPPRAAKNNSNLTSVDKIEGGEQQITVACRIRPLTEEEILEGSTLIGHKIADDNMIVLMDPLEDPDDILRHNRSREKQFVFDMVVDARTGQQEVFEKTTKDLLPSVLNGYNATVFAYGATGAGKTYTMLGTREEPGIMFRTLHHLFIEIERSSSDMSYQVSMSYLEIYNELIRDLLSPSSGFLELREDAKGGISVAGISEVVAETPEEVMYMLHKGNKERTQEPTKANKTSSRSHAVLQVNIKQRNKIRTHSHEIRLGKLYMIDLAGSERAAQTQNTGKRMVEGAHINRSLLALGNCINALSEKGSSKYVNYRDSKLTRILKDSLGGNSKTVMIAHISPASIHFEESRNTLTYADRAKYIRTKLRRNVIDVSYHISQYQQIIQELAQEIAVLKEQKYDLESRVSHSDTKMSALMLPGGGGMSNSNPASLEESLKLRESLLQSFKQQIKLRKNMLDLENAIMDINIEAERHTKIIENWNHSQSQPHISSPNGESSPTAETVMNAREELKVVEHDRDELEQKRNQTLRELELCRAKTRKLRDAASKKLTNTEQKEILGLLLKNFEFEMKNIEMQAELFKRDFKLREQDMVILRLEQHRSLCDTLISQQRKLIVDNNISLPSDLDELYKFYTRDTAEGQLVKDLSSLRSNSQVSINMSPKPTQLASTSSNSQTAANSTTHSTFLTQIQEENYNNGSTTPASMSKGNKKQGAKNIYFLNNSQTSNTPTLASPHQQQQQQLLSQTSKHHKNNLSNLSSSSNDTEIIMESGASRPNAPPARNLTAIRSSSHSNGGIVAPVIQPGQVVPAAGTVAPVEAKRHTQNIAAIAAQRRANKHHRELMQDIFENSSSSDSNHQTNNSNLKNFHSDSFVLTSSRMNGNGMDEYGGGGGGRYNLEKKNSVLTDGSLPGANGKVKKQVKIRDVVQFKLPDDNHYTEEMGNSYSPIGTYRLDDVNKPRERKSKNSKASNRSRSQNSHQNYANQLSPVRPVQGNLASSHNSVSLNNLYHQQNSNRDSNNNNNKAAAPVKGSIPNYMKGVNISIAGTSMLKN